MSAKTNTRIVLAARPDGAPRPGDFRVETAPVPALKEGEVLLETVYLSLDPYMRGRMRDLKSYAPSLALGDVIVGGTVSRVVASRHALWHEGDLVSAYAGWQRYAVSDGQGLRKLDPAAAPPSTALGVLGMPGLTAYSGLREIGKPKAGETVVVAAASGAVGSAVGQIARIHGARAVGIVGGKEKAEFVKNELGFDVVLDHRAPDFAQQLARACPDGIDVYFENVGGKVWDAVFPLLNDFARVPVCGLIAHYNDANDPDQGVDRLPITMREILSRRLTVRGFIVFDFGLEEEFLKAATAWVADGRLRYREDVVEGLENAPRAFIGLLEGKNFGKLVVKVGEL
ncbi:Putative oxidoreductase YncB [plant metagenome]|uniref:Oxidoreductase YncB n=1 Tax=plant metagenome TaxID=1297885 RepID=A0A484PVZ4_9ZZZZ